MTFPEALVSDRTQHQGSSPVLPNLVEIQDLDGQDGAQNILMYQAGVPVGKAAGDFF